MGQLIVNGNIIGEQNDTIEVVPKYQSGTLIAEIIINGHTIPIYIPTNGGNNE
jgi:hypothetical protein